MRTIVIGIDSGTESTKVLVVDATTRKVLASATQVRGSIRGLAPKAGKCHPSTWVPKRLKYPKIKHIGYLGKEKSMKKTVVELDLVAYSAICANLEEGLDVKTTAQLNRQIRGFIYVGLEAVGASRDTLVEWTGDGAIVMLDAPADAHRFAEAVHRVTREHNRSRNTPIAKRVFRIGAATGEIVLVPKRGGGFDIAGTTISRAVRLEANCQPGGLLMDASSYLGLTREYQGRYGHKYIVAGKRDEQYEVYGCLFNAEGSRDASLLTCAAGKVHVIEHQTLGAGQVS